MILNIKFDIMIHIVIEEFFQHECVNWASDDVLASNLEAYIAENETFDPETGCGYKVTVITK